MDFLRRDNEFIAWYPCAIKQGDDHLVWEKPEAAFYVHIPFCDQICDYCGFSVVRAREARRDQYLRALCQEITRDETRAFLQTRKFTVGHFGGGTPSVLTPDELSLLMETIDDAVGLSSLKELTLEANPISLTLEKACAYRRAGVNRLSLGVQSFNHRHLKHIGRPHRENEAKQLFHHSREAGFKNISIDLMYGFPTQTAEELEEDLGILCALGPEHISCFPLQVIPMTPLWLKSRLGLQNKSPLDESAFLELHTFTYEFLRANGYQHYGAFNFAREGYRSEHNRIAFCAPQKDYIGWGNSAFSFFNGHVFCNESDVNTYVNSIEQLGTAASFIKRANLHEQASRFVVLGLKFLSVRNGDFKELFGLPLEEFFADKIEPLKDAGMVDFDGETLRLTDRGIFFANNVCKEFYVGENIGVSQYLSFKPTIDARTINAINRGVTK